MESLERILMIVDNDLGSMAKNGKFRSREEIESTEKLTKIAKNIFCIMDMDPEDGYSERRYPYTDGWRDGMNYARGRQSYKRDSRGRYSMTGGDFIENLRSMMADAPDEQTRQAMQRMLDQMGR